METMTDIETEGAKYRKAWEHSAYRHVSPGEKLVFPFLTMVPMRGREKSMIDFGTGPGRAALQFHQMGVDMTMVDIADNCLDCNVRDVIGERLIIGCLWDSNLDLPKAEFGYCCDVMEHIPPDHVRGVLMNMTAHVKTLFLNIAFFEDKFGEELGESLHLTVKPYSWWRDLLSEFGTLTEARDCIMSGIFALEVNHG